MTMTDTGRFETANASKYLQQLCKHFGHKTEAEFTETDGRVVMSRGPVTLRAAGGVLEIDVTAEDADGLGAARDVIDRHLERFAFRESFTGMTWGG